MSQMLMHAGKQLDYTGGETVNTGCSALAKPGSLLCGSRPRKVLLVFGDVPYPHVNMF